MDGVGVVDRWDVSRSGDAGLGNNHFCGLDKTSNYMILIPWEVGVKYPSLKLKLGDLDIGREDKYITV